MANPAASELRDLDDNTLRTRLTETKAELFNLRFQHVTGQLDNSSRLTELRHQIARIHTELRTREIAAAESMAQEATRGVTKNPLRRATPPRRPVARTLARSGRVS